MKRPVCQRGFQAAGRITAHGDGEVFRLKVFAQQLTAFTVNKTALPLHSV
jgi:hypothetical protein